MHEQNREDRDQFVIIRANNIERGREKNFEKAKANELDSFGISYDFGSVLHYSALAFSKNGKHTIEPKIKTSEKMGQRVGLSNKDIEKVNRMYRCWMKSADLDNISELIESESWMKNDNMTVFMLNFRFAFVIKINFKVNKSVELSFTS